MATKQDLELAKMLLSSRVLDETALRRAFERQGEWLHDGRVAALPEVLYALRLIDQGALDALGAAGPEVTQPFPGYRIDGILGEGGMSTVYAATQALTGARVALKVMKPLMALRTDFAQRFAEEAALLTRLDHPGIVAAYESGQAGGYRYFSMDLIGGSTVQEVIERRGNLTNPEALSITVQVAAALDYLHGQGLLHRDMKPGNVMVEPSGRARLIDLGLVGKAGAAGEDVQSQSHTVGTVEYLSPEQARGRSDLDARTDIYSLGVSLYHMVVGEVPFQGETDMEVMAKQIMANIDQEKVKTRRVSPEMHFFIAKMTAKERDARFTTMKDVIREVSGYLPGGLVPVDLGGPPRLIPVSAPMPGRSAPTRTPAPGAGAPSVRPIAPVARPAVPPTLKPVAPAGPAPTVAPVLRPIAPPAKPPGVPTVAPVLRPIGGGTKPPPLAPPVAPPVARPVPTVPPVARPIAPPAAARPAPAAAPVLRPIAPPAVPPTLPPVARPVPTAPPLARPVAPPVVPPVVPPVARPIAPAVAPVARPLGPPPLKPPFVAPVAAPRPPTPAPPLAPPVAPPAAPPAAPKAATPDAPKPAPEKKPNPFAGKAPIPKHKRLGRDGEA